MFCLVLHGWPPSVSWLVILRPQQVKVLSISSKWTNLYLSSGCNGVRWTLCVWGTLLFYNIKSRLELNFSGVVWPLQWWLLFVCKFFTKKICIMPFLKAIIQHAGKHERAVCSLSQSVFRDLFQHCIMQARNQQEVILTSLDQIMPYWQPMYEHMKALEKLFEICEHQSFVKCDVDTFGM